MPQPKLKIRIPLVLEVELTDSEVAELADRVREDDGREDSAEVTDKEIANVVRDDLNDDFETAISNYAPSTHLDEDKITTSST